MIVKLRGISPTLAEPCFIAPSADVIGQTTIGRCSSIWFQSVLRGDVAKIILGAYTNIQDGSVVHVDHGLDTNLGDYITVGHRAILHGCTIHSNVLVGMGAVLLNGAVIEENCIIGAGALVTQSKRIPACSLVMGSPAKIIRTLKPEEIEFIRQSALHYWEYAKEFME